MLVSRKISNQHSLQILSYFTVSECSDPRTTEIINQLEKIHSAGEHKYKISLARIDFCLENVSDMDYLKVISISLDSSILFKWHQWSLFSPYHYISLLTLKMHWGSGVLIDEENLDICALVCSTGSRSHCLKLPIWCWGLHHRQQYLGLITMVESLTENSLLIFFFWSRQWYSTHRQSRVIVI